MTLTYRILLAMLAGLIIGCLFNALTHYQLLPSFLLTTIDSWLMDGLFFVVGKVFIASLKLLVVPLVLVSLVCGCASMGGHSRLGMIAGRTIGLYMMTTAIAIALALLAGSVLTPGDGMGLISSASEAFSVKEAPPLRDVIINIFPSNPFQAMAEANMLQVIVFAILVGVALSKLGSKGDRLRVWFEDLNELVMKMVTLLMQFAPYGVFSLLVTLFADLGFGAIKDLINYFMTVVLVLVLHATLVYPFLLKMFTGLSPILLFQKMRSVLAYAFSTSSSGATLPITLEAVEHRLGVDNKVASFTVPLGATINMDGTAIMQGVATAFIAQAYGIDIGLSGYLMVILTATLASVGTAGVPGVGLITLAMVLNQVNLPVEGIALIIGVDRLLDMMRTAVNVTGDAVVSCVVADKEQALDHDVFNDKSAGSVVVNAALTTPHEATPSHQKPA